MLSAEARTLRDGQKRLIPADQLVRGDIVLLESGDRVVEAEKFVIRSYSFLRSAVSAIETGRRGEGATITV